MPKVINLFETPAKTKVVDLSRPMPTCERVIKGLATVALVAGTIAAGASAAHAHCTKAGK